MLGYVTPDFTKGKRDWTPRKTWLACAESLDDRFGTDQFIDLWLITSLFLREQVNSIKTNEFAQHDFAITASSSYVSFAMYKVGFTFSLALGAVAASLPPTPQGLTTLNSTQYPGVALSFKEVLNDTKQDKYRF